MEASKTNRGNRRRLHKEQQAKQRAEARQIAADKQQAIKTDRQFEHWYAERQKHGDSPWHDYLDSHPWHLQTHL